MLRLALYKSYPLLLRIRLALSKSYPLLLWLDWHCVRAVHHYYDQIGSIYAPSMVFNFFLTVCFAWISCILFCSSYCTKSLVNFVPCPEDFWRLSTGLFLNNTGNVFQWPSSLIHLVYNNVCVCVCVRVCMCACVHAWMFACIRACVHACVVWLHACKYTRKNNLDLDRWDWKDDPGWDRRLHLYAV